MLLMLVGLGTETELPRIEDSHRPLPYGPLLTHLAFRLFSSPYAEFCS